MVREIHKKIERLRAVVEEAELLKDTLRKEKKSFPEVEELEEKLKESSDYLLKDYSQLEGMDKTLDRLRDQISDISISLSKKLGEESTEDSPQEESSSPESEPNSEENIEEGGKPLPSRGKWT